MMTIAWPSFESYRQVYRAITDQRKTLTSDRN